METRSRLEEFASSLLDERIWFGKYPTPEEARTISRSGFTHIVNLCTPDENTWEPYKISDHVIINYPFCDGTIQRPLEETEESPNKWKTFYSFINGLVAILEQPLRTKIYIHCLGGHGRSPTIAAIVYGRILDMDSATAIKEVKEAHQKRKVMKDKWRKLGAPHRAKQKRLIKWFLDRK